MRENPRQSFDVDMDVVSWLKNELRKDMMYAILDEVWGPAIYGTGVEGEKNYQIVLSETGEWILIPKDVWQPPEIPGMANVVAFDTQIQEPVRLVWEMDQPAKIYEFGDFRPVKPPHPWGWEDALAVVCKVPICQAEIGESCQDSRRVLEDGSFALVSSHKRRKRAAKHFLEK